MNPAIAAHSLPPQNIGNPVHPSTQSYFLSQSHNPENSVETMYNLVQNDRNGSN